MQFENVKMQLQDIYSHLKQLHLSVNISTNKWWKFKKIG